MSDMRSPAADALLDHRRWSLFAPFVEAVAKGEMPAAFYTPPAGHGTVDVAIIPRTEYDPLGRRCSDRLADEVAVLVRRKVIDARSPAADALLDYRDPPSTERADRMAELEARRDELLATIVRLTNEVPFPDEVKDWQDTSAKLVAEVGTLRARSSELATEVDACRSELANLATVVLAFVGRVETRRTGFYTNVQRDDLYQRIKALVLP